MKFKVGDKVKILDGTSKDGWVKEMLGTVRCIGVIIEVSAGNPPIGVEFSSKPSWWYNEEDLELVESADVNEETEQDEQSDSSEQYSYYKYSYKGIKLDPYRILDIYGISCPAQQHAIKKLLRAGNSVKELRQDIQEVIDTLKRKLEMLDEDEGGK